MTEFVAKHRFAKMTARKGRYVIDMVRGMPVNAALDLLANTPRRAAFMIRKVVQSAVANASQDASVNLNKLTITRAFVDDGPLLQGRLRWRAGPQGRYMPFRKRTCHVTVVVGDPEIEAEVEAEAPTREKSPHEQSPRKKSARKPKAAEPVAEEALEDEPVAEEPDAEETEDTTAEDDESKAKD